MNTHAHRVFVGDIIKRSVSLQNMKQILSLTVLSLFSPCALLVLSLCSPCVYARFDQKTISHEYKPVFYKLRKDPIDQSIKTCCNAGAKWAQTLTNYSDSTDPLPQPMLATSESYRPARPKLGTTHSSRFPLSESIE